MCFKFLCKVVQNHLGKMLSFIENKGFSFNKLMLTQINAKLVAEFYKEHQGKAFYEYNTKINLESDDTTLLFSISIR